MKSIRTAILAFVFVIISIGSASAHNVWAHTPKLTAEATLEAFYESGEVYYALVEAMHAWDSTSATIEEGVMPEFEFYINKKPLKPRYFKETLFGLEVLNLKLESLDEILSNFHKTVTAGDISPDFDMALKKILAEDHTIVRLSMVGARYSDVSGKIMEAKPIDGIAGIVNALQEDLVILRMVLKEVISATRQAIPLAEKGEFAKVMLSGRNAFGDKMPQFTDMISAYERLYVQLCLATIASTMQVFPKGYEWLK